MGFMKKHVGQQWYPDKYYAPPPLLFCKHRGVGNPLIQQTEIHTCRHPFTCWI